VRNRPPAPDVDLFAGQAKPAVDPLPVLRRLLKAGATFDRCDRYGDSETVCHFCRAEVYDNRPEHHTPDCPYVEAVTLFGDPNAQDAPRGVINP